MVPTTAQYSNFEAQLNQALDVLKADQEVAAFAATLVERSEHIVKAVIDLGNSAEKYLQKHPREESDDILLAYVVLFESMYEAKRFLLLWRDSIFNLHNARIKESEGLVPEGSCQILVRSTHQTLLDSARQLLQSPKTKLEGLQEDRRIRKKSVRQWQLQKNPLAVYTEQFQVIPEQCERIQQEHLDLYPLAHHFNRIRSYLLRITQDCFDQCQSVASTVEEANQVCRDLLEKDPEKNLGKVAAKLEDFETDLGAGVKLPKLEDELSALLAQLPEKMQVPIGIDQGMVLMQEFPFHRKARLWLDSEILPLIFQIQHNAEQVRNESRMTLLNLRNWSLLLSREQRSGNGRPVHPEEFSQLPNDLRTRLDITSANTLELRDTIQERLASDFRLSAIYRTQKEFLPSATASSTLAQLRGTENSLVNRSGRFLSTQFQQASAFSRLQVRRIRGFLDSVEKEETLSNSEKIVRFLEERRSDPSNGQYESIFRAQGFISTSFIVGRTEEMAHVGRVLESWEKGFRGSLLLTGKRFAGKTLFGERIAEKHFEHHTVRLQPNSTFTVQGRKYETTYDLSHALELIRKYTLNYRTLVWIDDLEHWWDPEFSYFRNARAVKHFLEHQSNQTFLMISMGNTLRPRLGKLVDWDGLFQAHVNLDKMHANEIHQAIEIRHNATHQRLVDHLGNPVPPKEFKKITRAIYQASGGNIGEALAEWAYSTQRQGENSVENRFRYGHPLPDFLDEDLSILLASIMMQRRTNEFRLRQFFGPAFNSRYSLLVRRMLNVGVLSRGSDDWLEINPILANELGQLLQRDAYLKYSG